MTEALSESQVIATVLSLDQVSCGYGASVIVRDVSLAVGEREIVTLLGRNGMGKTTLVRTIMGFLPPLAGKINLMGHDVTGNAPAVLVRAGVSYAPQEKAIFQDLSIAENLKLAVPSNREYRVALPYVFKLFPFLEQRLRQPAGTLSGGEQKMLTIARAIMSRPRLLLLDEVSEGLQPSAVDQLSGIIVDARRTFGMSILLIEQNLKFAWSVADRWAVFKGGGLADQGNVTPEARKIALSHLVI
jgi:ABC-type branched-subunit amino acid transport system ATPase component